MQTKSLKDSDPIRLEEEKIILVEGRDDERFFVKFCKVYDISDIQILRFEGVTNLQTYLTVIQTVPDYEKLKSILIIRDADNSATDAILSIQQALKKSKITSSIPSKPYEFNNKIPNIAFVILPGFPGSIESQEEYSPGMLEDLCLETIKNTEDTMLACVDKFLSEAEQCSEGLTHKSKSRLHAYLSVKNKYVGMKLGEAANCDAWDMKNACMRKIKDVILEM